MIGNKYLKILFNKEIRFDFLSCKGFFNHMPDKEYLEKRYKITFGKNIDWENPRTFNEKLQWLKLYNKKSEYTNMVDKYVVREYIANKLGNEYLIPLIGVWDSPDIINFDALPEQFVLKCNHNSGGMCICKDKSKLDIDRTKNELNRALKRDYYLTSREWPYKNVKRKIIAEKYMVDESGTELKDYKLMCFNGRVKCTFVCSERYSKDGLKMSFFDREWNEMPFTRHYPKLKKRIEKPISYEKMIEFAEKLAVGIPFVRIDFYDINGHLYFGEITFFPGAGFEKFSPENWDLELGNWINLPDKKIEED